MVSLSAEKKIFSIVPGATCITTDCHADIIKKKYMHYVASDGWLCIVCHKEPKEGIHAFELRAKGSDLCFKCHDEKNFEGITLHGPVTEGKCLECHQPHGSNIPAHVRADQPKLCLDCHSVEIIDTKGIPLPSTKELFDTKEMNLHKPFAEGKCTACHLPHPADSYRRFKGNYPGQFYASYTDETYDSCLRCHEDLSSHLSQSRTLTDTWFRNGNLNLHYRHVNRAKGRTCRTCHHHHGSRNSRLVRETFTFGKKKLTIEYEKTETGGTCVPGCHVPVQYDRYEPVVNAMKTSPREGRDATPEELKLSRERDRKRIEEEQAENEKPIVESLPQSNQERGGTMKSRVKTPSPRPSPPQ
jgi:predicted CXXCH cytochrome family protein